jgi:hypothetical protein
MERRWAIALVIVAVAMAVILALAPLSRTQACVSGSGIARRCTTDSTSLLEHEGSSVLLVLAIPVLLAGATVAARTRRARMILAGTLTAFMVLGLMTIGVFLLPIVALAWGLAYSTSASSEAK